MLQLIRWLASGAGHGIAVCLVAGSGVMNAVTIAIDEFYVSAV
jgi:hypothetical protein